MSFWKASRNVGMILLAVWMILYGVVTAPILNLRFAYEGDMLALFAVAVGILLLMNK